MLLIQHKGHIILDGHDTGLGVVQTGEGTVVFTCQSSTSEYKVHSMPFSRYSLSHEEPSSGVAGRTQFKADILALVKGMSLNPERWWEKGHVIMPVELDPNGGAFVSALGASAGQVAVLASVFTGASS